MSLEDDKKTALFMGKIFGLEGDTYEEMVANAEAKLTEKIVPLEYRDKFQGYSIGDGLFGSNNVALCLECGAIVHPNAVERHSNFHYLLREALRELGEKVVCVDPSTQQIFAEHDVTTIQEGSMTGNYVCVRCGKGC